MIWLALTWHHVNNALDYFHFHSGLKKQTRFNRHARVTIRATLWRITRSVAMGTEQTTQLVDCCHCDVTPMSNLLLFFPPTHLKDGWKLQHHPSWSEFPGPHLPWHTGKPPHVRQPLPVLQLHSRDAGPHVHPRVGGTGGQPGKPLSNSQPGNYDYEKHWSTKAIIKPTCKSTLNMLSL